MPIRKPLSQEDATQAWNLFKNSALWNKWPEFETEIVHRLGNWSVPAGETLYRPGDPADRLFLVGSGSMSQEMAKEGQVWFRRELNPGDFFGQHSLFSERHETKATARTDTTLYVMTAADLRVAMEKNSDLRESLLHETRAGRLRSIPLFECMDDEDIRWLAQLVVEEDLEPGQSPDLENRNGLWIIDWGQVAVSGAASFGRADWRLTAGNFFLAPAVRASTNCVAETATATVKTHLLYLADQHLYRLLAAFPELNKKLSQPIDIVKILDGVPQLTPGTAMATAHLWHLAQFCAWAFVPAGQNITTQGTVGYSFIIINDGAALVSAVDDQGRLRPRNLLRLGEYFGFTSLLESKPRDATVRAVRAPGPPGVNNLNGAEVIILDRRDLQYAFAERPDLWHQEVWLFDRYQQSREKQPAFDWLEEGESVVWTNRSHWLWLALPLLALAVGFVALVLLLALGQRSGYLSLNLDVTLTLLSGLLVIPVGLYIVVNYYDDYYVITTRRVTRRDRELLTWEARSDAPLEMVQDVTVDTYLLGRILNFGKVTIRTAAKIGAITFDHVPDPDLVRADILRGKAEAVAATRGQNKEMLRRGLMGNLRMSLPAPDLDRERSLGQNVLPPEHGMLRRWMRRLRAERPARAAMLPGAKRGKPAFVKWLVQPLPERAQKILIGNPPPPPAQLSGQVIWHKHWINFLQRAGWPLAFSLALLFLGTVLLFTPGPILTFSGSALFLAWLVLAVPTGLWLWWEITDYWNDVYVVTDDRIIDIEKRPLGLSAQRRESSLDRVQTVYSEQKGFSANLFNYGNVIIQTAAADAGFTFQMVGAPKLVQRVIFQKLDVYRRKQEERQIQERQRALIEGLEVYHELREERANRRLPRWE